MITPNRSLDRITVEEVAQQYRDRGYKVVVQPDVTERPDFVREYQPDIIATSQAESVVIEVKDWVTPVDKDRLQAIAKRVESRPGWKFIVVSPGEVRRGAPGPVLNDLSEAQINGLLVQVGELRASRHLTAALVMAWSALEASMRRAAEANEIPLRRPDTLELMRELVSNGVLERNRYREISEAFRLRSAVAHGFDAPDTVNLGNVLNLLETTTRELLIERAEPGPA